MKECAVIMAGGPGTRFWPVARNSLAKQYLKIFGEKSLIQTAFERNSLAFGKENVFVCTNTEQTNSVINSIPIKKENFVIEPFRMDTAAAIGLSTEKIVQEFGDAVIAAVPSDHLIKDTEAYVRTIKKAVEIAKNSQDIVTIGIAPSYAATALGYIEIDNIISENAWRVKMFREKPNRETAEEYITSGKFFWNAGMFIYRAEVLLEAIKKFLPSHFEALEKIGKANFEKNVLEKEFAKMEKISIDYGVMEKASNVSIVKAEFDWDDVGSWNAFERVIETDEEKNTVKGIFSAIESSGNIVYADSGIVSCIGVKDMAIIKTSDAVLVCKKNDVEKVKELVKELEKKEETKKFV